MNRHQGAACKLQGMGLDPYCFIILSLQERVPLGSNKVLLVQTTAIAALCFKS